MGDVGQRQVVIDQHCKFNTLRLAESQSAPRSELIWIGRSG